MTNIVIRFGKRLKIWLNFLLDRTIDLCNFVIFWSGIFPSFIQNFIKPLSYFVGNVALLLGNFPRIDSYKLAGKNCTLVFVGSKDGLQTALELFFRNEEVTTTVLQRVAVYRLPTQCKLWLKEASLVICELSQLALWKPSARWSFSGPDWIMHVIDLPTSSEELLSGRRIHGPRRRIRQAEKNGYKFRFTRSLDDYYLFYDEMYLPFVQARHGEHALIVPMKDQRDRWFKPGGLILVTKDDKPVAGSLVIRTGKMAFGIEMGVLNCDPGLLEAGVIAFLQWGTILWCYEKGVRHLNLGGSKAYCANGSFDSKAKWGARVVKQKRITSHWYFMSDDLPDSLRAEINRIGVISENKKNYYRTYLAEENHKDLEDRIKDALEDGLSGLALVQNGSTQYLTTDKREISNGIT